MESHSPKGECGGFQKGRVNQGSRPRMPVFLEGRADPGLSGGPENGEIT